MDGELLLLLFECSAEKKEKITLLHKIRCVFGVVHRARVSSLDKLLRLHIHGAQHTEYVWIPTYIHTHTHWIHLKIIMIVSVI